MHFVDGLKERAQVKEASIEDDLFAISSLSLSKALPQAGKGLGVVSMDDLVMFFGRFAEVAVRAFARDVGRPATSIELAGIMRQSSLRVLLVSCMTNSREVLLPLVAGFEGKDLPDLNDIDGEFSEKSFEIREAGGVYSLHLKQEVIAGYRAWCEAGFGQEPVRAYGCPALHTGLFYDMYDWVASRYEEWLQEEAVLQAAE